MISFFKQSLVLASILFLIACGNSINKPKKLLTKTQMISIMTELQLLEASMDIIENDTNKSKTHGIYYHKVLLKKFDIDSTILKENLNYYTAKPEVISEIYDSITVKLSEYQSQNQALLPK